MNPVRKLRRFVFPAALTLAGLLGAAELGVVGTATAFASTTSCSNTECEGNAYCRYARGLNCAFSDGGYRCTNTSCGRAVIGPP